MLRAKSTSKTRIVVAWSRDARAFLAQMATSPVSTAPLSTAPICALPVFAPFISTAPILATPLSVRALNVVARRAIRATVETVENASRANFPDETKAQSSTRLAPKTRATSAAAVCAVAVCETALSFVSDAEIFEMNAQYRGKNKPTDVLSFAQNEGEVFPSSEENAARMLGDVVISIETARRQAEERAHSLSHEIEFLCVHGTLHLLGFDHITDKERRQMWRMQDAIVEILTAKGP